MTGSRPNCINLNQSCDKYIPAKCIYYSGNALSCSGIKYADSIDLAIQKLDAKICSIPSGGGGGGGGGGSSSNFTGFNNIQMLIGDPSSILIAGDNQIVLFDTNIAVDSVWITKDGMEMSRDLTDRKSYHVLYEANSTTVNFNFNVETGDLYILHYAFNTANTSGISWQKEAFKIGAPDSLMAVGDTTLTTFDSGIIINTLTVVVDGKTLNENSSGNYTGELNYIYSPTTNGFILTFSDPAVLDQDYLITYAKNINS